MPGPSINQLLDALDPEQRVVAESLRGPVRVLAGAGTGKTRAITHRIAHGVAAGVYVPTQVLAVTFTTRAAGEMRGRLRQLGAIGVQARTFHSAALRQVRYFWPQVYSSEPPQLLDSKLGLVAAAVRRNRVQPQQTLLRDLASEIEWAKVSNVQPEDYAGLAARNSRAVNDIDPGTVARIFGSYEEVKREQGRMDMEDVLLCAVALLSQEEQVAAAVRRQYSTFVVDEFQDVSPLQATLLDLWLGGREEICVVGDPAQTIYSFAGARASYLTGFTAKHPDATTVELVRNYRSTPQIVGVANELLRATASQGVQLRAQAETGPAVSWVEHPDEVAEAVAVAAGAKALQRAGVPLREMAVLFRVNAQSETLEEALTESGLPYVIRGAARFFDRAEVRQAMAMLRVEGRRDPDAQAVEATREVLSGLGWSETAPSVRGQARDKWESWQALLAQAEEFAAVVGEDGQGGTTLSQLCEELERRAHEQHAPVAEGVTLATLHTAKGLEWDAVFCVGLQEGSMPISYARTSAELEEERRLLYVGITRARRHLSLSWSLARNPGGQGRRKPSRFLTPQLPRELFQTVPSERSRPSKRRRSAAVCRICRSPLETPRERNRGYCMDCPIPYDPELFDALKEWRKERAGRESVPAYVVFSDSTLEALAEVKPRDRAAMLRVNGVGAAKLEKYADDVLKIVGDALV